MNTWAERFMGSVGLCISCMLMTGFLMAGIQQQSLAPASAALSSLSEMAEEQTNRLALSHSPLLREHRLANRQSVTLPILKRHTRALKLKTRLNAQEQGTFILDTGATYMSISREMATRLGVDWKHARTIPITTANGQVQVPLVTLKTVEVDGLAAHDVKATVMPMHESAGFSGLLGLSFIQQFHLTLDPDAGTLTLKSRVL